MSHHGVHEVFSLLSMTSQLVMGKTELRNVNQFYPKFSSKVRTQGLSKIKEACTVVYPAHVLYKTSSTGHLHLPECPGSCVSHRAVSCQHFLLPRPPTPARTLPAHPLPPDLTHSRPPSVRCLILSCLLFLSLFLLQFVKFFSASCICLHAKQRGPLCMSRSSGQFTFTGSISNSLTMVSVLRCFFSLTCLCQS